MNGFVFQQVVAKIFMHNGYKVEVEPEFWGVDRGADLWVEKDGKVSVVEIKYFLSLHPQISTLTRAIDQVLNAKSAQKADSAILVVSSKIPSSLYQRILGHGIELFDAVDLMDMCTGDPELAGDLSSILPTDITIEDYRDLSEKKNIDLKPIEVRITVKRPKMSGRKLKARLEELGYGRENAKSHEKLIGEILIYLFSDFISEFKSQGRNFEGMNIYDFVCRVKTVENDFWKFVINERQSRYVVFECKNYEKPITQEQVLTTEKYLFLTANRSVAFLISRHRPSDPAILMSQGAIRETGKFILHISDEDLKEMLDMKDSGEEPSDHLFTLTDKFLMGLGR